MKFPLYRRRSILFLVFGMPLLLAGCKERGSQMHEVLSLDGVAHSYVRLAVALGEHDFDSIDYYVGPEDAVKDIRHSAPSVTQIHKEAAELSKSLASIPASTSETAQRKAYLLGQLKAIACRANYLAGSKLSFDDEIECSFGVKIPAELDMKKLADVRRRIDVLLGGKGSLAERYENFESHYAVPPAKLRAVMDVAIAKCKEQTKLHITLPADEQIDVEFAGQKPWSGFSRYTGNHRSIVTINTDFPLTVDRVLDLACHETYPGHHVFNMLTDDVQIKKNHRDEFAVQPTYSPQSFFTEGAATIASEIAFTHQDRLEFERDVLFPAAGVSAKDIEKYFAVEDLMKQLESAVPVIVRKYLDGEMEFVRTGEILEAQVLMRHYFETLKYLNEFRSYVVTYTYAPGVLERLLPAGGSVKVQEQRWQVYESWIKSLPVSSTLVQ